MPNPPEITTATDVIPTGVICMWSGTIATIPSGWALCNGSGGTPDLRDKFIVGATVDDGGVTVTNITGTYTSSGGTITHTHGGSVPSGGSHQHAYPMSNGQTGTPTYGVPVGGITDAASHTHSSITIVTENHLPIYYALAFIMKT